MIESTSQNNYFQDGMLEVVYDITKDLNQYKFQVSNNNFNNLSILEGKIENLFSSQSNVNDRINKETGLLYDACKNQFEFMTTQISNVINVGTNFDSKVSNLEKKVEGLYDTLKKFELNINSRFDSLEQLRQSVTRVDQSNIYLGKQIDFLIHWQEKNEQKLDHYLFQKEALASKNINEDKNSTSPLFNKKIEKIYQNLDSNLNATFPVFSSSKSNFDIKSDKTSRQDRRFDFSNVVFTEPYNFPKMTKDTSNVSDSKNVFDKAQGSNENFYVNVNSPSNNTKTATFTMNENTNAKSRFGSPGKSSVFDNSKFC